MDMGCTVSSCAWAVLSPQGYGLYCLLVGMSYTVSSRASVVLQVGAFPYLGTIKQGTFYAMAGEVLWDAEVLGLKSIETNAFENAAGTVHLTVTSQCAHRIDVRENAFLDFNTQGKGATGVLPAFFAVDCNVLTSSLVINQNQDTNQETTRDLCEEPKRITPTMAEDAPVCNQSVYKPDATCYVESCCVAAGEKPCTREQYATDRTFRTALHHFECNALTCCVGPYFVRSWAIADRP